MILEDKPSPTGGVFWYDWGMVESREVEQNLVPEPRTAAQVVDLIKAKFEQVSPNLRHALVESNVVLTLAGMKGMTEFFIHIKDEGTLQQLTRDLEILNQIDEQIHFRLAGKPFRAPATEQNTQMVSLDSLPGIERISKISKLPGVTPFAREEGWEGLVKWRQKLIQGIEAAEEVGSSPKGYDVLAGIVRGYPDTAILDFADWIKTGQVKQLEDSQISGTGIYEEAEPNFDYYPEHANDPGIIAYKEKAGSILQNFYESDWHAAKKQELSL